MREYDVEVCSEECRWTEFRDGDWYLPNRETGDAWRWTGDWPCYCPKCGTRVGIDERGPWRERMVPRAALEWLAERHARALVGQLTPEDHSWQWIEAALKAAEEDSDE
jgi:hypothetical protein